ncbi:hypothetical protein PpBr36_02802 [Pyricularia pennisetigena]|uniref:hypothetical protein n=1 Tax=Pyricularia pennisetigena TaxID=1578925 RepID=UPI00114DC77D|nr:hypothetical protein PpBr36_02802 [Pyricularia pennisetigena]TLS30054.1 hypothetical protein PpBr36_02802 [Pyricularia pennisetigena]
MARLPVAKAYVPPEQTPPAQLPSLQSLGHHLLRLHPLASSQNARLAQDVDALVDRFLLDAIRLGREFHRVQPRACVLLRVVEGGADVLDGLLLVLVEVLDALVQLAQQVRHPGVSLATREELGRCHNLPAAPRRYFLDVKCSHMKKSASLELTALRRFSNVLSTTVCEKGLTLGWSHPSRSASTNPMT